MRLTIRSTSLLMLFLLLEACAVAPTMPFIYSSTFDESEISWSLEPGDTTIEGSAYIVDRMGLNGTTHTCVGYTANLSPKSNYVEEFFNYLFNNLDESFWNIKGPLPFMDPGSLGGFNRSENCDVDGRFTFYNVPNGTYYLTTTIYYIGGPLPTIPPNVRGGLLLKNVVVSNQENIRVVMTL